MNALAGRIRLDFRADEPIYAQIVRQIEALVTAGTLKPGDQLPTVRELAIDLRINFSTVARAYRILDEQRLISTQRGRGTYIWDQESEELPVPAEHRVPAEQIIPAEQVVPAEQPVPGGPAPGTNGQSPEKPEPGAHGVKESRVPAEKLAGLAHQFIREAADTGASAEQIEQIFHQQLDGWKRSHPDR